MNKKLIQTLILYFSLILIFFTSGLTQQKIESQIQAIENELRSLQQKRYDLISPTHFKNAMEQLTEAQKSFSNGEDIRGIEKKLEKASQYLKKVNEVGTQGAILFKDVLDARDDALEAQAPEFAAESFQESEMMFLEASKRLEKGDLNGARKGAQKTEEAYRKAEFKAIKESIVGNIRDLIRKAEEEGVEKYAPTTLDEARKLYNEVIAILESDRYAKSNAREMANQAEYETIHAIYLTTVIKELKKDDKKWEMVFRNFEDRMNKIASELGFKGHFENGFAETENDIVLAIQNLKLENSSLREEFKTLQKENEELKAKIQQYEKTVVSELQRKKEWEEKLNKIQKIFTKDEAQVLLLEKQMIIRLYGLTFRSGTAIIAPEHFMLLTKVMRALREFPNSNITVAGHTDSQGNDAYNFNLSENRAAAVRAYLEANMGLPPDQLKSVGYGETRPIASNETIEGRQLNRRIEIIIDLESKFSAP
ncbi:MAG: hypothetical protein Kow0042_16350 [Calditrichia bacterium]